MRRVRFVDPLCEVPAATLDQVVRGRGGPLVLIENDVGDVARQLQEIHESLRLRYNQQGQFFVVYQLTGDGEKLVTTAQVLDARLVEHIRRLVHPSYDFGAEVDRLDAENDRRKDYEFDQKVGEIAEELAHAVRTDIRKSKPGPVYIPPDIAPSRGPIFIPRNIKEK